MSTKQQRKRQKVQIGSNSSDTEYIEIKMAASADVNNKKGAKSKNKVQTSVPNSTPSSSKTVPSVNSSLNVTAPAFTFPSNCITSNPFGVTRDHHVGAQAQHPNHTDPHKLYHDYISAKLDYVVSKLSKLDYIDYIETDFSTNRIQIFEAKSQIQDVITS
jgi:hypothetical protein